MRLMLEWPLAVAQEKPLLLQQLLLLPLFLSPQQQQLQQLLLLVLLPPSPHPLQLPLLRLRCPAMLLTF